MFGGHGPALPSLSPHPRDTQSWASWSVLQPPGELDTDLEAQCPPGQSVLGSKELRGQPEGLWWGPVSSGSMCRESGLTWNVPLAQAGPALLLGPHEEDCREQL